MNKEPNQSEIILYKTQDGDIKVDTVFRDETIWLTQTQIAELFGVKTPAISKHLKNIFESGELDEKVVVSILEHTTTHGAIEGKTLGVIADAAHWHRRASARGPLCRNK